MLQKLEADFRSADEDEDAAKSKPEAATPTLAPERPAKFEPLPYGADDLLVVKTQFTGRQVPLGDLRTAIDGMLKRFRHEPQKHNEAVQLIWLHGFGGMGKSWFLKNAWPQFIETLLTQLLPAHPGYYGEMVWILSMLELWLQRHAPHLGRS